MANNPAGFISIAAVQSQKRSYVFYSASNGNLSYLKSQVEGEGKAGSNAATVPPYETESIIVKNRIVAANTTSPQIAAVSYTFNNHDEIHVYYISDEGYLQELRQTDGGSWTPGTLNNIHEKASPKTLLTASVDYNYTKNGQLKVYYNRENEKAMRCVWVTLGDVSWSPRYITEWD